MAAWKFTDDYGAQYPALSGSILSELAFSAHALNGANFTGTLDVNATGPALETLGQLLGMATIDVTGKVIDAAGVLTVTLKSADAQAFKQAIAAKIPLIGGQITQSAELDIQTVVAKTDDPAVGPKTDIFRLNVVIGVGARSVTISMQVPMHGGFCILQGDFTNVGVTLNDVKFLMGGGSPDAWFPGQQLGPYYSSGPALDLLHISLTLYLSLNPFSVTLSSAAVEIGITDIPLMAGKLYLNPLGVSVLMTYPAGTTTWSLEGTIALCNYARPGDVANPDFAFDFAMGLSDFSISGELENPNSLPINTMLQDLLGQGTSVGLPSALTIEKFDFAATADKASGSISSFSADVAMSGGFGLLQNFDFEEISISVAYSA